MQYRLLLISTLALALTACGGVSGYDRFQYHAVSAARMSNDTVVGSLDRRRLCPYGQVPVEDYSEIEEDSELEVEIESEGLFWRPRAEFEHETEGRRVTTCINENTRSGGFFR